jgi:hypothetical protein
LAVPFAPDEESVVKLYLGIGEAERHFNTIQSAYRLLASTWTLAALGGIGYVLTSRRSLGIEVDKQLICGAIALSGAASILILWLVDIRVYQQILSQHFNEGMAMEAGEPWLPQPRNQTRRAFKGWLAIYVSIYYILLSAFLLAVACLFLVYSPMAMARTIGPVPWFAIVTGLVAILIGWILWSQRPKKIIRNDGTISFEDRKKHYEAMAGARAKPPDPSPSG